MNHVPSCCASRFPYVVVQIVLSLSAGTRVMHTCDEVPKIPASRHQTDQAASLNPPLISLRDICSGQSPGQNRLLWFRRCTSTHITNFFLRACYLGCRCAKFVVRATVVPCCAKLSGLAPRAHKFLPSYQVNPTVIPVVPLLLPHVCRLPFAVC